MRACTPPPRPPGTAPGFGAQQPSVPGRAGSAAASAALRGRGTLGATLPAPRRVFGRGRRGTASPAACRPGPPGGGALRASSPTSRGAKPTGGHRGSPRLPGRHSPRAPAAARARPGASPLHPGYFIFFFGGSGRWQLQPEPPAMAGGGALSPPGTAAASPRGVWAPSGPAARSAPRGRASCAAAAAAGLWARTPPRRPAGGICPAGKSFTFLSPTCVLLKTNEKLFRLLRFVALAKRRPGRPSPAAHRPPPSPSARGRALPGPRAPSPAGGGREEGGSFPGKEESGSYVLTSAF
ncbi:basic proline-rich protein-like [Aquila chrysaetos chrysaetos]|uniref:basic proline-rich protein-like n=1 Tax=Aquila chrysaetos chrysaetos TaxID=223781 RepID=UPI00117721F0|nr:basic proline-rich protein-like [Aquila chrysaetos chrysaetos]